MLLLLDLPMELLVHISDDVNPTDVVNWVCVAKQIYASASQALSKHQVRFADYSRLSNRSSKVRRVHLPDLFREVLKDKDVAFYVRSLSLKDLIRHGRIHAIRNAD